MDVHTIWLWTKCAGLRGLQSNSWTIHSRSHKKGIQWEIFTIFAGKASQLWRWNDDKKLENKEVGIKWNMGHAQWVREGVYLKDEKTGKVLDVRGGRGWTVGTEVWLYKQWSHVAKSQVWYLRPDITGKFQICYCEYLKSKSFQKLTYTTAEFSLWRST